MARVFENPRDDTLGGRFPLEERLDLGGLVEYFVLFFIHIATRRVHISGMTPTPDAIWMTQQARNMSMYFEEQGQYKPTHIIRDRDTKFTANFCSILEADGTEFRPIPARSPNMNPHAEAWVQRVKRDCLDWFIVFGERHLRYLLSTWLEFYYPASHYLITLCFWKFKVCLVDGSRSTPLLRALTSAIDELSCRFAVEIAVREDPWTVRQRMLNRNHLFFGSSPKCAGADLQVLGSLR